MMSHTNSELSCQRGVNIGVAPRLVLFEVRLPGLAVALASQQRLPVVRPHDVGLWLYLICAVTCAINCDRGEPPDRLGLTKRTIPVTTSATPMINIGQASLSPHPGG